MDELENTQLLMIPMPLSFLLGKYWKDYRNPGSVTPLNWSGLLLDGNERLILTGIESKSQQSTTDQ